MNSSEMVDRLLATGVIAREDIIGASSKDIAALEKAAGHQLPATYVEFLKVAGRAAGEFMSDLTVFYPKIMTLTETIRADFEGLVELPDRCFVFMNRMGEIFYFFIFNGDNDPAVYGWSEKVRRIHKVYDSFWDFVADELRGFEEITK